MPTETTSISAFPSRNTELLPNGGRSWEGVLESYLAEKDIYSDDSRKTYRYALTRYFKWIEKTGRSLDAILRKDIIEYKQSLESLSSMTVSLYVIAVRGFYEWTESHGLYPNVAKGIKADHDKGVMKMHLSAAQCRSLLEEGASTTRDNALMTLLIYTGMRTVEVERAKVRDMKSINGKSILYIQGKGHHDKKDFVVLSPHVEKTLREYLSSRGTSPETDTNSPLFVCEGKGSHGRRLSRRTIQHIVKKNLRRIGIDSHEYSAHCLRHTTATLILQNGGTMFDVQKVLRHASVDTSQIYVRSLEMERRIENSPETLIDNILEKAV